jgi:hypothetical protein
MPAARMTQTEIAQKMRADMARIVAASEKTAAEQQRIQTSLTAFRQKIKQGQGRSGDTLCSIVNAMEKGRTKMPRSEQPRGTRPSRSTPSNAASRRTKPSDPCESPTTLRKLLLCMRKCCANSKASNTKIPGKIQAKGKGAKGQARGKGQGQGAKRTRG